ncbi:MAG TPA: hypothetical protein VGP82_10425 [Ktedonobacterales bacterium]|jgi:hypothetical protein|nr:hypothetical protein [Ktedonobacterales bacterium]
MEHEREHERSDQHIHCGGDQGIDTTNPQREADATSQQLGSRQPPLRDERIREGDGSQSGAARGKSGMIGSAGGISPDALPHTTGPIGAPMDEGGAASPGSGIAPGTQGNAHSVSPSDVLGTPGNVGRSTLADVEPGTPYVPGTLVPGPIA